MILSSVKDEGCFSTLSFLKSKLRKYLTKHSELVVRMFAHDHYNLDNFPFGDAMRVWNDNKVKYAVNCQIIDVFC
jgi:hypothetical protein